ncbi:threonine/serine exporter family protein [Yimella sp. cx-573]|nr:threonine/serine exporter family protein [Yimella sp. cx-573]
MSHRDDDRTRQLLAYLSAALIAGGAASHEVEQDIRLIARRLGHPAVQVHAQPVGVALSLGYGTPATYESVEGPLRLDQSVAVARIQRALLDGSMNPDDALLRLRGLRAQPHRHPLGGMYLGGICVAIGLALILQPSWNTVGFALLTAPFVVALMRLAGRGLLPTALMPCIAAFGVSLAAFWAHQHGYVASPLRTLLPPVAVLLPGATIVTGLSELVNGAAVAGTARLAYGATQLVMFAIGIIGAAALLDVDSAALQNTRIDDLGVWSPAPGLLLVTAGICLMEAVPRRIAPWVLTVLAITAVTQLTVQEGFGQVWPGAFAGAAAATLAAWVLAALRDLPRMVLFLPSFWLLVPGSVGLVSVAQLGLRPELSGPTGSLAVSVILALALGLVVGTTFARLARTLGRRLTSG